MERILIIDDEAAIREMLRQMLEREGFSVVTMPNGNGVLELQRKDPVDLVITDLIMPEKEGISTIKELKDHFPDLKIIAMTGGGRLGEQITETYLTMAKKLGATKTFSKPISRTKLLELIREVLPKQ